MSNVFLVPLQESALYLLAAYGLYLLLKVLRFPDISTDNVFAFGGIAGTFCLSRAMSTPSAIILASAGGFLVGAFTSSLHSLIKIPKLLAGILTYSMLFSLNLKFFGRPNIPLPATIADEAKFTAIVSADLFLVIVVAALLHTRLGKSLVTVGANPTLLTEFQAPKRTILLIGVGLANALIAASGFLTSFYFGFSDVGIGMGVLVNSVAAIMIAEEVMAHLGRRLWYLIIFLSVVAYNILLYLLIRYLSFGFLDYSDYKLVSGIIIICLFLLRHEQGSQGGGLLG